MTITSPWRSIEYEEIPFQELLIRAVERSPEKVAIIDGGTRISYCELLDRSNRRASALTARGVSKGDRVALLAWNCAEFVIASYGVIIAGAVLTTINSGYREGEIAHQLSDSGSRLLIVHESLPEVAKLALTSAPAVEKLVVIGGDGSVGESFESFVQSGDPDPPKVDIDPKEDLAALPYSSGTTGLTKGVMLTHFNLTSNIQQLMDRDDAQTRWFSEDVVLVHLPLFHIYGLNVLMGPGLAAGATLVMMGRFEMELLLDLLEKERITVFCTVPPVVLGLTAYPELAKRDLSSIRIAFVAAAPSSADLQDRGRRCSGVRSYRVMA